MLAEKKNPLFIAKAMDANSDALTERQYFQGIFTLSVNVVVFLRIKKNCRSRAKFFFIMPNNQNLNNLWLVKIDNEITITSD